MENSSKVIFISGAFDLPHIGHQRLFQYSKTLCPRLVVGVFADDLCPRSPNKNLQTRIKNLAANKLIDELVVIDTNLLETIEKISPDIILKGSEFEKKENIESSYIENNSNAQIIFAPGLANDEEYSEMELSNFRDVSEYLHRHNIFRDNLQTVIKNFQNKKIIVIGDSIVDEYIDCEPLGMSQEDPTIVVRPMYKKKYIGGAAIVAGHARTLGADVTFMTTMGIDETSVVIETKINQLGVELIAIKTINKPTTLKSRYRANGKTLLRVSELNDMDVSDEIQHKILEAVTQRIENTDLLVFSDFSYGLLTDELCAQIIGICHKFGVPYVADSQSSSQIGDVLKFKHCLLLTPTEREIRLALRNKKLGLRALSDSLIATTNINNLIVTVGANGLYVQVPEENVSISTDVLPALSMKVVDPAGCGDSLLITAAMSLCSGSNIWEAAYLGSLAAAIQISRTGNIPISAEELINAVNYAVDT